jgi:hypothetical protein
MSSETDELRSMLSARAGEAGQVSFTGDELVRKGRLARRRRIAGRLVEVGVAVAAVVLVGAALITPPNPAPRLYQGSPPPISASARPYTLGLGIVEGHRVRIGTQVVTVPLDLTTGRVTRVRGGWVYLSADAISYFDARGRVTRLAGEDAFFLVGPDGVRVAWVTGSVLTTARLDAGALTGRRSTPVPPGVSPVTFSGDRVVLVKYGGFDTWDPAAGPFVASWARNVDAVYGPAADGRTLIGAVPGSGGRVCLAMLDPATLRSTATSCDLGLRARSAYGSLSPDGRYFFDATNGGGALIDVGAAFAGGDHALQVVPDPVQPPTWDGDNAIAEVYPGQPYSPHPGEPQPKPTGVAHLQLYRWHFGEPPARLPVTARQQFLVTRPFP